MNSKSPENPKALSKEKIKEKITESQNQPLVFGYEETLPPLSVESSTRSDKLKKFRLLKFGTILSLSCFSFMLLHPSVRERVLDLPLILSSLTNSQPKPKVQQPSVNILPVETQRLTPVDSYQVSRIYTGEIVSRRSSELGFERSGQVVRITVDEGDRVKAGTPLAYLDTRNHEANRRKLLAQRAQAVAQLKELEAGARSETIAAARATVRDLYQQLELARTKLSRRQGLYTEGAISREQLDEVTNETSVLQARLDEKKSQLDELLAGTRPESIEAQKAIIQQHDASIANLDIELQKSVLRAPFTGTISARLVDEGTVVSPGQSILRLVENGNLEARIGVPVANASQLRKDSTLPLKIGSKTYPAKISSILPELDFSTRTLTLILTLHQSAVTEVSPGQVARLEITEIIPSKGYWLPTTALVKGVRGLWSCYTLGKPAPEKSSASNITNAFVIERRDVEILQAESNQVLVRGTLQPGDQVIINGTNRLVPGQLVHPIGKLP